MLPHPPSLSPLEASRALLGLAAAARGAPSVARREPVGSSNSSQKSIESNSSQCPEDVIAVQEDAQ